MAKGLVSIQVGGTFDELAKQVGRIPNEVLARGADKIIGSFGSEIRKKLGSKQERQFHLGSAQTKSYNGHQITRTSKKDATHGWYKGQGGTRIIGFGYENLAYQKASRHFNRPITVVRGTSNGYVYSLINNLWGHSTNPYKKKSPLFNGGWYGKEFGRWKAGTIRKPKETYFNDSVVTEAVAPTMQRAEQDLQELLTKEGF